MSRNWKRSTLVALAALVAIAGCAGSQARDRGGAAKDGDPLVLGPSDVAQAAVADLVSGVSVSGTLEPAEDVNITAPLPEVLEEVLVKEGQAVSKGQVLARFRSSALEPAAASADAQRRMAAADYERMNNLLKAGAVSNRDVENAEATLKGAEANAALARKLLEDATVRAPLAGVIARRSVQSGDRVGDGDPLFRLVNVAELEFEATIPSIDARSVRVGSPVALSVTGLPGASISGRIARVNATADPATRQVKVYVSVPNRDRRLVGDLFASGRVILSEAKGAIAVPIPGVREDAQGKSFVWVVAEGRSARREVTTGIRDEAQNLVQILSGLKPGDTAIVGPVEGLVAGQAVQIAGQGS